MFPDLSAILNEVAALLIVLVPVEVLILRNIAVFRQSALRILGHVNNFLESFQNPTSRKALISDVAPQLGHGFLRALKEESGSAKGVGIKADSALGIAGALGGDVGALMNLPGKIELPIVGKVTIGEALTIANAIKGVLQGGGVGGFKLPGMTGSSSSGSNLP